jgi:hypothetical protein
MFDARERLRATPVLQQLLGQYAQAGAKGPVAWQERLLHLDGVAPGELVKWHGELLAAGWVELHVGHSRCCYRATIAGLRAFQQVRQGQLGEEDDSPTVVGNEREPVAAGDRGPIRQRPRQRRQPPAAPGTEDAAHPQ